MCEINQKMHFEVRGEYFSLGLNHGQILLYAMIKNFDKNNQPFIASNHYLSIIFDVSERTIQLWIQDLKKRNLISSYYKKEDEKMIRILLPILPPTPE